jgi:hypothetical protein
MKVLMIAMLALCGVANADLYKEIHGDGVYSVAERFTADKRLRLLKKYVADKKFLGLAEKTEDAISRVIEIAALNLERKNEQWLALEIREGWEDRKGILSAIVLNMGNKARPITDFDPVSQWLANITQRVINALGFEIAHALRITDLHSLNYGARVVFNACTFGHSEFQYHFADDPKYRAFFPVVAYWTCNITCGIATFSMGIVFPICAPISYLCQWGAERVGMNLADTLYEWACE